MHNRCAIVLKRFTSEVVLCFDADNAGLNAADKTFAVLAPQNFEVLCVEMPQGEDPDSMIKSGRLEEFKQLLAGAKPFHEFKIDRMSETLDFTSARDRVQFANEMAESIAKLSDPVARDAIVHNVATRLGTSAEEIRKRMANLRAPRTNSHRENTDEGNAVTPLRVDNKTVRLFCKLALTDTATKQWLEENQEESEILNDIPDGEILMQIWKGSFDPSNHASVNFFLDTLTPGESAFAASLLIEKSPGHGLRDARRALSKLAIQRLELHLQTAQAKLRDKALENEDILRVTTQIVETNKEIVDRKSRMQQID